MPLTEKQKEFLKLWQQSGKESLAAQVAPETLDKANRTVDVIWFTGIDVPRYNYWTDEPYLLRFDPKGVDLTILNSGAPVADCHQMWCADDQKGRVEKAWVDGKKYMATLRFSRRPEVDGLWMDIEDKIVTKFSMGASILDYEDVQKKDEITVRMVSSWQPFEISIAPIPADFGTDTLAERARTQSEANLAVLNLMTREIEVLNLR